MWTWLKGPGKAFRKPLPGSTNYLGAYDKQGQLARMKNNRDGDQADRRRNEPEALEDEDVAAKRDMEDENLSEEDRELRAEQRKIARATREAEVDDMDEREGRPRERLTDLRPYPLNHGFRSQPVLSEDLREMLYIQTVEQGHDLSSVAATFGVDLRRVAAVVRLKTIEKQWQAEGKPLATAYSEAVLKMLPTTPFKPNTNNPVTPHEPINDLPVHPSTRPQIFYPASESRSFTCEDAAAVFDRKLLPADKRIPLPMLVDLEKWKNEGLNRAERTARQIEKDRSAREEAETKERKKLEWEERTQRTVPGRRWDFNFQDISAEKVGKDGRGRDAIGFRYGMPHIDRKAGVVKIPTSVQ
ncbi:hypothetical protein LTR78_003141 [Recurvomyces mirabilis]|uniref:Eukaryotic mitochondrial regulator protein-domain-containing protein n=1 Tax=Recurvomyces mirabilis TaxID=574656 RepID=A0AAE0WSF0_9PEZI|nr:hypothetical protein LTR78_003141 [Recurvomyces mirabilis]KAK5157038.1 hypothetical protein LTS14_004555 [Recurvomyces mirabilis]